MSKSNNTAVTLAALLVICGAVGAIVIPRAHPSGWELVVFVLILFALAVSCGIALGQGRSLRGNH